MKIAFLYAGQGAQRAGMGLDLYETFPQFSKRIDDIAGEAGFDLKEAMFGQHEDMLKETHVTQPALAAFATGVTAVLSAHGIVPDCAAGLSLGEYSALSAAGVLDPRTLIRVTAFRGREMEKAGEGIDALMCAVLGLSSEKTEEITAKAEEETGCMVRLVNYNTVGQDVIAGLRPAVRRAEELARDAGCRRCMELKVSSAFHTPFMEPASLALREYFKDISFNAMEIPVYFNATGTTMREHESLADLLVRQVKSPVHMKQIILNMKKDGVDTFIEIGPGHALSGFVKRAVDGVETCFIDGIEGMKEALDRYGRT